MEQNAGQAEAGFFAAGENRHGFAEIIAAEEEVASHAENVFFFGVSGGATTEVFVDAISGPEGSFDVLGVVANVGAMPPGDFARNRWEFAGQSL